MLTMFTTSTADLFLFLFLQDSEDNSVFIKINDGMSTTKMFGCCTGVDAYVMEFVNRTNDTKRTIPSGLGIDKNV